MGFMADLDTLLGAADWIEPEPLHENHALYEHLIAVLTELTRKHDYPVDAWVVDPRTPLNIQVDQYGVSASVPANFTECSDVELRLDQSERGTYGLSTRGPN